MVVYANQAIKNTAMRFKFNSIVSRYQAFKRQWTDTLRKNRIGHLLAASIQGEAARAS